MYIVCIHVFAFGCLCLFFQVAMLNYYRKVVLASRIKPCQSIVVSE